MTRSRWRPHRPNQLPSTVWERRYPAGKVGHVVPRVTWCGVRDYLAMLDGRVVGAHDDPYTAQDAVDAAHDRGRAESSV